MTDDANPTQRAGGSISPAHRTTFAKARDQKPHEQLPHEAPSTRYELRDPFAEVTYRSKTFDDVVAQAERLGATRFQAIGPDGERRPVNKVHGAWPDAPTAPRHNAAEAAPAVARMSPPAQSADVTTHLSRMEEQAARAAHVQHLQAALHERYVIRHPRIKAGELRLGQTEYRFRGEHARLAFTESTFRLSTDSNNPAVARSMVDVAEARSWRALRVSGNEDFKRLVWLEASVRGIQAVGYTPQHGDLELLRREREARQVNRIEPATPERPSTNGRAATPNTTPSAARGNGGRKTVLAALEAVLIANRVPAHQREAVMVAAADNLTRRLSKGEVHKVKVYDPAAPSQRPDLNPERPTGLVPQRSREQAAPAR